MKTYIAFLRGINVGGNSIIPMSELKAMCEEIGFAKVRTFIQSGNVVFESQFTEVELVKQLEDVLFQKKQKHISLIIRNAEELELVPQTNPYREAEPSKVAVLFFKDPVPTQLSDFKTTGPEIFEAHGREIFIHYPDGMGKSKLKLPKWAQNGTARNINSVNKLVEMSRG